MEATDSQKMKMEGLEQNFSWSLTLFWVYDMSYYKSNIAQQFQNDPDNYNVLLFEVSGEYPKTALYSICYLHENFWNYI